jgi:hypothetical protein
MNKATYQAILKTKETTSLSINAICSLCFDLQLANLPDFKVDKIEVYYTDDEGQKKVVHAGNMLTKKSNLKHKDTSSKRKNLVDMLKNNEIDSNEFISQMNKLEQGE